MRFEQEFTVNRPLATVWEFFQDVPQVADCLPGAELTEDKGDGSYAGRLGIKLGPMSANFEGEARVEPDAGAHSALISGKGVDKKGGSRGQVKVTYALSDEGDATRVDVNADITLSGAVAQFGRTGLIAEMSSRLIGEFVECLEAKLSAGSTEEAAEIRAGEVRGLSLFISTVWSRIVDFFKKLLRSG